METVYMVCAAVGGTLIVCQFLVTLLGMGGHHDGGGHDGGGHDMVGHDGAGHDAADHHDTEHSTEPNWFFTLLTFRTQDVSPEALIQANHVRLRPGRRRLLPISSAFRIRKRRLSNFSARTGRQPRWISAKCWGPAGWLAW